MLVILGPTVWDSVLGNLKGSAPFPYDNPAIFSVPLAFIGSWLFSVLDKSQNAGDEEAALRSPVHPLPDRPWRRRRHSPLM